MPLIAINAPTEKGPASENTSPHYPLKTLYT